MLEFGEKKAKESKGRGSAGMTPNFTKKAKAPALKAVAPTKARNSPFPDGYDIEGEREALADMIAADDLDMKDPRFQRFAELERREGLLKSMKLAHRSRDGAEEEVDTRDAIKVQSAGNLTDESEDTMTLHTREASRLFVGRARAPGETGYGQSGGKKVGAALRAIWHLSSSDNPYADFALIEANDRMMALNEELEGHIGRMQESLLKLEARGLKFSIVRADPPVDVVLGFRSPYGYAVVQLISTFDFFVRMTKTLVRKNLMADKEGYKQIFSMTHEVRRLFERVVWFQRLLGKEEMRQMSRSDWLPIADEQAKKRVTAAVELFGQLPREVFTGAIEPRHSRRALDMSPEELRLLNDVPLAGDEAIVQAASLVDD